MTSTARYLGRSHSQHGLVLYQALGVIASFQQPTARPSFEATRTIQSTGSGMPVLMKMMLFL